MNTTIISKGLANLRGRTASMLILVASLLIVPFVGFTSTASAAYADCPSNTLCIWEDAFGAGTIMTWGGGWHNTCWNIAPSMNDKMSSAYNRLPVSVTFFKHAGCGPQPGGNQFTIGPEQAVSTGQAPFVYLLNDQISSIYFN